MERDTVDACGNPCVVARRRMLMLPPVRSERLNKPGFDFENTNLTYGPVKRSDFFLGLLFVLTKVCRSGFN
jgi:hypothetical protein